MTDIFVIDDKHPEDLAMLQALYSRSPASVVSHLEKLEKTGSGKFMDNYYVGYGHASIGDCGTTTLFIEQVSMLVAKAIQDNPLYNGQEASTRYLDFSKQAIIDPYAVSESRDIQDKWLEIYNRTIPLLMTGLEKVRPFDPAEYKSEKSWRNTLLARAFDIARSLLPLGTTTLLSWSTTLRQARDNLRRLKHHPLPEVRETALSMFKKLVDKYPHSFKGDEMQDDGQTKRDLYARQNAGRDHFLSVEDAYARFSVTASEKEALKAGGLVVRRDNLDLAALNTLETDTLSARPPNTPLPWRLESYGRYQLLFLLDYGSFRDVQRHRNGVCPVPLLDGRFGMHPWYLEQFEALLTPAEYAALMEDLASQFSKIEKGVGPKATPLFNQYLYPMGVQALVAVNYSVPQTAYVGELRSGKTVHGSLRPVAQKFLELLAADCPGMALYGDRESDDWSAKRGDQTIGLKSEASAA